MLRKFKYICCRCAILSIECLLILTLVLAVAVGLFIWRLTLAPIDIAFAKDYIETILQNSDNGSYAKMDRVVLHWPNLAGPLLLGLEGTQVFDINDKLIISIEEVGLALSKTYLLAGKIAPVSLIIKGPELRVIRMDDGNIDIGFGDFEGQGPAPELAQAPAQTALTTRILQYIARPDHAGMKEDHSPLSSLRSFEIQKAKVIVEDQILKTFWNLPRVDAKFKAVEEGLDSEIYIAFSAIDKNSQASFLKANFLLRRDTKHVYVRAELKNFDSAILAKKIPQFSDLKGQDLLLNGGLSAELGPNLIPLAGQFSLTSDKGALLLPSFYDESLPYENIGLEATYDAQKEKLDITDLRITTNGLTINAAADLTFKSDEILGPVSVVIEELDHAQIVPLWPKFLEGENAQIWLVERLSEGSFQDLSAKMTFSAIKAQNGWETNVFDLTAGFSFKDMSVDYRSPMFPVKQAKGSGRFDLEKEKLFVDIESAIISNMSVTGAQLNFTNIMEEGAGRADIKVQLKGPVKTGLKYVMREPIALEHRFDLEQIKGDAEFEIGVKFPTVKDVKIEDVKVTVSGTASNVALPDVVKDLDLTDAAVQMHLKGNDISFKGKGQLAGRPVTFDYKTFLSSKNQPYKNQVSASIKADPNLRTHLGIDLSEFLEGTALISLIYTEFRDGASEADIMADLTSARLFIKPFDYEKPSGTKGTANLKAHLVGGELKKISNLTGNAPSFKLGKTRILFHQKGGETKISQGKTDHFVIGKTVAALDFEVEKSGQYKLVLEGDVLDLRPFLDNEGKEDKFYDSPPMLISIAVDRMLTGEGQAVKSGKIYVDIDKNGSFRQLEMDAIAGAGDIYLRFKPDASGKRVFRLEADDAGAALRAFGLYDKIRGGKMVVYGEPIRGIYDRNLIGVAELTDFKVVEAPGLAQLLGAMSLPGLMSALGEEGLSFSKLEVNFDWLYRRKGSLLVLKDGRTSGNSLGLTFDGTFDKSKDTLDVSGTLVPLSGLNTLIGNIPVIGDILTGGTGSVFAATYKAEGKASDPEVFVNPLSVLTPGILRRILFE